MTESGPVAGKNGYAGLLAFEDVVKRRREGRRTVVVLDQTSLDIAPGEFVGLRGPRRAGKTTLLRIAAGIDQPDSGVVRWDGRDVATLSHRERAGRLGEIGFVPQSSAWRAARGKAMIDHVALPLLIDGHARADAMARAHAVAERVGARAYVEAAPDELPPDVLTRLSIARALVRGPRLLVIDQPDDAGDRHEGLALHALLLDVLRERPDRALLLASRDLATLHGAHRVMSIAAGHLRVPERRQASVLPFPEKGSSAP